MNYKNVYLGILIQTFVKENNINSADLARKLGKNQQSITERKRKTVNYNTVIIPL